MKKPLTIVLALVACVAIIVSCVFGVQNGSIRKDADAVKAELQKKIEDLEAGAADAAAAAQDTLESTKAELQGQLDQLTEAKAGLEKQLTDQAETAKAELETKLAEAAAEAKAQLEAKEAELQAKIDALTAAKAELEKQLTEQAEASNAELEAVRTELQKQIADREESAKAELETTKAELEAKLKKTERALTAAKSNAYIMYANSDWSVQNWGTADSEDGSVIVTPAAVTGEGEYTIGLEFPNGSDGLAFTAIGINNGEIDFPGYYIRINAIRVNGEAIEVKPGYTSSDDGKVTRMNILNEWVTELPADARAWDGNIAEASPVIVDKAAFASVKTMDIDFSVLATPADHAYIMYADGDWNMQNWEITDSEDGNVKVTAAEIRGTGTYTVGLEFAEPAKGLAFSAIGIQHGEITYPGYYISLHSIRVNGEEIICLEGKQGYTSSDNGIETRMNILNAWVAELPEDARVLNGDLSTAAPVIVDAADFESVKTLEIEFSFSPISAYLMFANGDWSVQNWGYTSTDAVKVTAAPITGEGTYTVGLEFAEPSEGLAFTAVGLKNGEAVMPGTILQVTEVKLNDGDNILNGITYTSSDDGQETRANIYNTWVTDMPEDARTESGDLANVKSVVVDPELFTGVTKIEATFRVIRGKEPVKEAAAEAGMSQEEADALKAAGFHAYIGVQGKDTYIFRNAWYDNYGRDDAEHPWFYRLTGWDDETNEDKNADYGGTFYDSDVNGDGEYAVSLVTGEKGFGTTAAFNLLFVSTDIPSKLIEAGYLTISNVKTKVGGAATQDYTEVDLSGEYALIRVIDTYNQPADPFGYTVPGADETITISFTVSGW